MARRKRSLKKTETVFVEKRTLIGRDARNNPCYEYYDEEVCDIIVCPGPRDDINDASRLGGVIINYTLHFPKAYRGELEGLRIKVRDEYFHVIGSPKHYSHAPGQWDMPVEVSASHG